VHEKKTANSHGHHDHHGAADSDQPMSHTAKTILVVEDNDQSRMLFRDLLISMGYSVFEAKTGMDGYRIARERHPEIILMDIQLPDVSGLEVTKWLKSDDVLRTIPVLAVTILSTDTDRKCFLSGGCDGHIPKPISIAQFLETVERFAA
jgi:two-component system cell cycle response regulator DivK